MSKNTLIHGEVEAISKRGKAYNIKVDGDWFGAGFERPKCSEGDLVKFQTELNGKWVNMVKDSLEITSSNSDEDKPKSKSKKTSTTHIVNSKDDFWAKKEQRDVVNDVQRNWGASRNTAIAFVDLLIKNEALKLPTVVSKKADAILDAVEYYAAKFRITEKVQEPESKNKGDDEETNFQDLEEDSEIDE